MKLTLMVPETTHFDDEVRYTAFDEAPSRRSRALVPMDIESVVTLTRTGRSVDVKTKVDNQARNHRLRLLLIL